MTAAEPPAGVTAPDRVGAFMRAKLVHSAAVLEGLSLEDYDLIEKGAQARPVAHAFQRANGRG
ncbi:MAG: hypothetical protein ACKOSQ_12325 [Planctomycetaceae bacterium]